MKNNYKNLSIDEFGGIHRAKILQLVLMLFVFLTAYESFGQGASCATATAISVNTEYRTLSITDTTLNDPTAGACNGQTILSDGWVRFVASSSEARIVVAANNRNPILYAYSGTCASLTQIGCVNATTSNGTQTEILNLTALVTGDTYFIRIGNAAANPTTNPMTITSLVVLTNNNCNIASPLTVNAGTTCSTSTVGTTIGATQSIAAITCGGFTGNADDDVWYSFVATGTSHIITATPAATSGIDDIVLELRTGACNGTNLACSDSTTGAGTETITATGLTVGSTYYVRLYNYNSGSGQGGFTICVTTPIAPTITSLSATNGCVGSSLTITGTNLASATGVTIGGTATTITANTATSITVTVGNGTTGNVVVTTSGGTATSGTSFTVNALPATPTGLSSNSPQCASPGVTFTRGTPPAGVTWYWQTTATGTSTANSGVTYNVTTSGTYYIRAQNNTTGCWSTNSASLAATINTTSGTATGPSPANAATSVCYSGTGAVNTLTWTAVSGATSYDVYFGAGSLPGTITANVTTASYGTGTLAASTTYYWRVVPRNSCGITTGTPTTWSFTTNATICYCASTSTNNNEYISRVVSGGFSNTSAQTGYRDYTNLGSIASVMQGTATSTIRVTTSNGHANDNLYLFADWNQDGDFADAGETVTGPVSASGSGTYTLTVTVPAGATIGTTRIRIKLIRNTNATPCHTSFNNGEVEDYLITVIPLCSHTVTATSGSSCGPGTVTLTATGGAGTTEYRWYEYISSGSPVAVTPTGSFVTPSLSVTKTYYVTAYNGVCESPRFPVNAFVYPAPSSSVTPAAASLCDGVIELVAIGSNSGTTDTLFYEDFEVSTSTLMMLQDYGSSANGYWYIEESPSQYISYETISSGSNFGAIDSAYDLNGFSNNALTMSAAISTYNYTSLALTFRHYYDYDNYQAPDQAIIEVNTDGDLDGIWTTIQTYTSDQGSPTNFATVTINLSAYINQPNLRVRFRYYSGWNYGWNVDDIRITGTSVPSPVAWTPIAGLYTDSALTIPYIGGNIATVYAYPDAAQTYTATVTNGSGCQATDTAVISGSSNIWNGTSWSSGTAPVAGTEKVIFNGNYSSTGDISGCLLQVNSGNVVINADNTVTVANQVRINPTATFTLEDTASLLQTAGTTNTNIGIIRSKRRTQPVKRLDFTYWSSPVAGQTLYNLSPATMADKYYSWNPVSQAWVTHMNGNVTMTDAKGYIVRAPQSFSTTSAVQYEAIFQGVPNNGDISIPVYGNTSTLPADYKWNLIGNPYPSAVDLDEFLSYANNVAALDGTIYLWTHNSAPSNAVPGDQTYNYTANDYATYNLSGGVATSPATPDPLNPEISDNFNGAIPTKHLASGQAFFVRGLVNLPARFTNDMRIQDENNRFFRNMNPVKRNAANSGIEKNRFWLNLRNNQGAFNQTLVGYIEGATNGLDRGFDGSLFGGNHVTIYSINDSQKLAIQGRALPFDNSDVVNLGIKTTIAGAFTISLDMLDGLFVNQDIYLKDNLQNAIHNLKSGPYSFTTGIGTFENRFQIVYRNEALGIPEFNPESIVIYKKDKDVVVTSGTAIIEGVKVFDIQGRLLFDGQKINASEKVIKSLPPTDQVLIVQVVTTEGIQISRKIIY